MIRFLCPFLITDLKQIPKNLVTKYNLGLEGVIFDGKDLEKKSIEIKNNLIKIKNTFPKKLISLHYPNCNGEYINGGKKLSRLLKFIKMAHELGVEKIILHSNYILDSDIFDQSKLKSYRLRYLKFFDILDKSLKNFRVKICIENMPIIGTLGDDFDSIFVFPEDFNRLKKYENIKINWDFGHWAITCKMLWDIRKLSPRTILPKVDFFEYLKNEREIIHFHLSSFSGNTFINTGSLCKEGIPPARGDVSESYFIKALKIIKKKKSVIDVSLEINESNYYNRKNLKETLTWIKKNKLLTQNK